MAIKEETQDSHAKTDKSERKHETWTVMVYLAGDNNLSTESLYALTEMKRAKLNASINIIAQFDPKDDYLPTRRYKITSNPAPGGLILDNRGRSPFQESGFATIRAQRRAATLERLREAVKTPADNGGAVTAQDKALDKSIEFELLGNAEPVLEAETDTGSPAPLFNFMSFCLQECPADHYMVVLSGHGGGTEEDYLLKDESSNGSLTIAELKQAFVDLQAERGGNQTIDILGMDSCLMSMTEVCYELRGLVDIVAGCESYSPASGWPYCEILERLAHEIKHNDQSVRDRVAKGIVEEYVNFYADYWLGGLSVTQSALDVRKVEKLKSLIDALATELVKALNDPKTLSQTGTALILAHWEAQSYNGEQFVDLADFCHCLGKRYPDGAIPGRCEELANFIVNEFVLKSCYSGPVYQYSHGASLYFPWAKVAASYDKLEFNQKPSSTEAGVNWADFLKTYTVKTRRAPRDIEANSKFDALKSSLAPQRFRKTDGMGPGNPTFSMRNPPLIALPDDCIRAKDSIIKGLEMLAEEDK